jgi:hypothetical protein
LRQWIQYDTNGTGTLSLVIEALAPMPILLRIEERI